MLRTSTIIVMLAGLMLTALLSAAPASAGNPFTVSSYPVQAEAANAVEAKAIAMESGKRGAFRSLLKRLVAVTAHNRLPALEVGRIEDMIEGISVRSERNSRTEYLATLDFGFRRGPVTAFLKSYGLPYVERQAQEVALMPLFLTADGGIVASDQKLWRQAWAGLDLVNALAPLRIVQPSEVIRPDILLAAAKGDQQALRVIETEMSLDHLVIARAERVSGANKVTFALAGEDTSGPLQLERTFRIFYDDLAYTSEWAALIMLGVLDGRWKAANIDYSSASAVAPGGAGVPGAGSAVNGAGGFAGGGAQEPVAMTAEFSGLGEWQRIRQVLSRLPGAEQLEVALSARSANIALTYPGGAPALQSALAAQGLALSQGDGGLLLRVN